MNGLKPSVPITSNDMATTSSAPPSMLYDCYVDGYLEAAAASARKAQEDLIVKCLDVSETPLWDEIVARARFRDSYYGDDEHADPSM